MTAGASLVGRRAASGLVLVGVAYAVTLSIGMAGAGLDEPIRGSVLTVMELLTLLSAPLLVVLMPQCSLQRLPFSRPTARLPWRLPP